MVRKATIPTGVSLGPIVARNNPPFGGEVEDSVRPSVSGPTVLRDISPADSRGEALEGAEVDLEGLSEENWESISSRKASNSEMSIRTLGSERETEWIFRS